MDDPPKAPSLDETKQWEAALAKARETVKADLGLQAKYETAASADQWTALAREVSQQHDGFRQNVTEETPESKTYLAAMRAIVAECLTKAVTADAKRGKVKEALATAADAAKESEGELTAMQLTALDAVASVGRREDGTYDAEQTLIYSAYREAASHAVLLGREQLQQFQFENAFLFSASAQRNLAGYEVRRKKTKPEYELQTDPLMRKLLGEINALNETSSPLHAASATLQENPEDAVANLVLAKFFVEQDDWLKAVEYYQHSKDPKLGPLAKKHQELDPSKATAEQGEELGQAFREAEALPLAAQWLIAGEAKLAGLARSRYVSRTNLEAIRKSAPITTSEPPVQVATVTPDPPAKIENDPSSPPPNTPTPNNTPAPNNTARPGKPVPGAPAGWRGWDVGEETVRGNDQYASGMFAVTGAGHDIYGKQDSFRMVYQTLQGDGGVTA
ncbi:MAG: hypothetical protein N2C14_23950, partial [Planctomycetales bacterium]